MKKYTSSVEELIGTFEKFTTLTPDGRRAVIKLAASLLPACKTPETREFWQQVVVYLKKAHKSF
jgi:hypothetical protein